MSMQDPIADMFVRIKNAQSRKKTQVIIPFSKLKLNIAKVLLSEGYIRDIEVTSETKSNLIVHLKYYEGKPVISMLKRFSLVSCRAYSAFNKIPRVMGGLGTAIVSTASKGVVSGRVAYKNRSGGEILGLVA